MRNEVGSPGGEQGDVWVSPKFDIRRECHISFYDGKQCLVLRR